MYVYMIRSFSSSPMCIKLGVFTHSSFKSNNIDLRQSFYFIIHCMKSIQFKEDNAWLYDSNEFY